MHSTLGAMADELRDLKSLLYHQSLLYRRVCRSSRLCSGMARRPRPCGVRALWEDTGYIGPYPSPWDSALASTTFLQDRIADETIQPTGRLISDLLHLCLPASSSHKSSLFP